MSELLTWKDDYALGIGEVDHEHRALIELINTLHAALGKGASGDEVQTFLAEIHAQIAAHFALEERVMRELRYAEYVAHKADHEALLDDIVDLMDACDGDGHLDDAALSARLDGWFSIHFRSFDARLHAVTG